MEAQGVRNEIDMGARLSKELDDPRFIVESVRSFVCEAYHVV